MNYKEIQDNAIKEYRIKLDPNSSCWGRTHAHPKSRRICKWCQRNSLQSTFTLLHEIGHIEANDSTMRRAEQEYHATKWAMEKCEEYGIKVPSSIIKKYQDYINTEIDRGRRRGGRDYGLLELKIFDIGDIVMLDGNRVEITASFIDEGTRWYAVEPIDFIVPTRFRTREVKAEQLEPI